MSNAALQPKPRREEERFTTPDLDGVHLHAVHWGERGAEHTLVLLHGGGAGAHWWEHLAPALAVRRHVVALDFRGHGDSDYPAQVAPGAFRRDLAALLDHLDRPEAALVGHSMGAHVASEHAAVHPETAALAMIEPSRGASRRSRRAARLALILRRSYATREQAVERFRFLPGAAHAPESLRRAIGEHSVVQQPDGRWGFKFDPRWFSVPSMGPPDLTAIGCPSLILRGSESSLFSSEGAAELVAEIPAARLLEIEAAGHHVQIDQPEAVQRALLSFLADSGL